MQDSLDLPADRVADPSVSLATSSAASPCQTDDGGCDDVEAGSVLQEEEAVITWELRRTAVVSDSLGGIVAADCCSDDRNERLTAVEEAALRMLPKLPTKDADRYLRDMNKACEGRPPDIRWANWPDLKESLGVNEVAPFCMTR